MERRKHSRFRIAQAVELQFGKERFMHVTGRDLSRGGIGCRSLEPIDTDSSVFVMIALDEGASEETLLSLEAHVVRCTAVGNGEYEVGLEFTTISDSDRSSLDRFFTPQ